jgi:pimeloyl-ACP methyl ester carboxylesterase
MPRSHLAVHFLGGDGPTALYAHATGFHAHCWSPIAAALPGLHNVGYDARGHGDTPIGTDWPVPDAVDWNVYGDDAAVVARSLSVDGQVLGVGHSMGGAALLMAAIASPELFCGLVLYEPIVMPPGGVPGSGPNGQSNFLAMGARKRRSAFASYEAAFANYAAKPPMNVFTPASLEAYVRFGFAEGDDGQVHLKCTPISARSPSLSGCCVATRRTDSRQLAPLVLQIRSPGRGTSNSITSAISDRCRARTRSLLWSVKHRWNSTIGRAIRSERDGRPSAGRPPDRQADHDSDNAHRGSDEGLIRPSRPSSAGLRFSHSSDAKPADAERDRDGRDARHTDDENLEQPDDSDDARCDPTRVRARMRIARRTGSRSVSGWGRRI